MKNITLLLLFTALSFFAQPKSYIHNNFLNHSSVQFDNSYQVDSIYALYGNLNVHIYKYDENQNQILDSSGYYSGNEWRKLSRRISTYNADGNILSSFTQYWNAGGYWQNNFLSNYSYIGSKRDSIVYKIWRNDDWEYFMLLTFDYSNAGELFSTTYKQWEDTVWTANSREEYIYNSDNLVDSTFTKIWLTPENMWFNSGLIIYTYDANGNEIEFLEKTWYSNSWNNNRKITTTFNENNQKTSWVLQRWAYSNWLNVERVIYQYDENGNMNFAYHETWDENNSAWNRTDGTIDFLDNSGMEFVLQASEINVFYSGLTEVSENSDLIKDFKLKQNFPNPFSKSSGGNPTTTIEYSIPTVGAKNFSPVQLKIFDVLGREITTLVNKKQSPGNYSIKFNASNLPTGIYFYRIYAGDYFATKKMILMK